MPISDRSNTLRDVGQCLTSLTSYCSIRPSVNGAYLRRACELAFEGEV
jgi:hypothetical protein